VIEADVERYADPQGFAREVNLPLLGVSRVEPVPSGAGVSAFLGIQAPPALAAVVDNLVETRQTLTLRSLLLAGFPNDPECFATGVALAREWSRRGLKIAVVDLDFWNPIVVRPRPHPNEGFVDMLEYGCSFRRVAWEIVSDGLWLIGPGSHPPDEARIVDHPDWERAARGMAAHVAVTLFVAPLLDRRGLVGRLSKRMDGVLLAASVERVGRGELRDAFLELWGSDAPIIGSVGIEPTHEARRTSATRGRVGDAPSQTPAETAVEPASPSGPPMVLEERRRSPAAPAPPAAAIPPPPSGAAPAPPRADEMARIPAAASTLPTPVASTWGAAARPQPGGIVPEDEEAAELAAALDREVRHGGRRRRSRRRSHAALYAMIGVGLGVAVSVFVVIARQPRLPENGETLPAGTEQVTPVEPEATPPAGQDGAPAATAPSADGTVQPQAGAPGTDSDLIPPSTPTPDTPFRVHVASFKSEEKVRELVRELRLRGADAWYEPASPASGYFRVFVGHFATEAEARAHARWLLENGWVDRAQAYPSTPR
jgi:cell division septation protein DedD